MLRYPSWLFLSFPLVMVCRYLEVWNLLGLVVSCGILLFSYGVQSNLLILVCLIIYFLPKLRSCLHDHFSIFMLPESYWGKYSNMHARGVEINLYSNVCFRSFNAMVRYPCSLILHADRSSSWINLSTHMDWLLVDLMSQPSMLTGWPVESNSQHT